MKKILLGVILLVGTLLASTSNIFMQHLRTNGIENFNIANGVLTIHQSGPVLKGELLKEAKKNGINKIVYYENLKDKAGYIIKHYAIKGDELVLVKSTDPFKYIKKLHKKRTHYSKHSYTTYSSQTNSYKVCKSDLSPQEEYYLTVQCNKLALGMIFNMKLQAEKFRRYGFNLVKANSISEAATTMTPQEHQYRSIFNNICLKTRAVFCKDEKPAMVVLKAYLNNY